MPERSSSARHVVVGTDFSPASDDAVDRAIRIAKQNGAKLHVVHGSGRLPALFSRRFHVDKKHVERDLRAVVARARAEDVRGAAHHVETGATKALRDMARELGACLVVVGSRGRSVPDTFVGSTAERIATLSRVPVLLVRRSGHGRYREVVVAVDFAPKLDASLEAARFVAPNAELSILHAYQGPFETRLRLHGAGDADIASHRKDARRQARAQLLPLLAEAGLAPGALVLRHGDPRRILHGLPKESLVVVQRGSVIAHALVGSVTRSVIAYGRSDVLISPSA
jgi:nucleotide-binding universal stress UspA family protein